MHRSRLGAIIIDCKTDVLDEAAEFWSQALGCPARKSDDPEDENYVLLETEPNELQVEVQKVDHPSRVHIDIEADDIEAEVRRLEKLGAKRLGQVKSWWIMEAPTGQRFCVIEPQRSEFSNEANVWEE
ncbi:MAG: VOC family protein [Rubrobacteraceae bacterium]